MGHTPLTSAQLKQFERLLLERQQVVKSWLQQAQGTTVDAQMDMHSEVHDTKDEAMRGQASLADAATLRRHYDELSAVNAALVRVATGQYGLCVDCGRNIATDRLRSQPNAFRCRPCQSLHEQASEVIRERRSG